MDGSQDGHVESTTEHTTVLGGSADTWGRTWAPSELNDANFRLRLGARCTGSPTNCKPRDYFLDWVAVNVYFTPSSTLTITTSPITVPGVTLNERGDSYSIPLYPVPDRVAMRTLFRRTYDKALPNGVTNVTPWIALGSGYVIQSTGAKTWSFDYDFDLIYSWHIGAEVNDSWFGDRPEQFAQSPLLTDDL